MNSINDAFAAAGRADVFVCVGPRARVLGEGTEGAEQRCRFVESFVRPHGLDKPATPAAAAFF